MADFIIQGAGYLASLLLALSLIVTNDIKFRWLNTGGCIAFIVYGILIGAFPIILTNGILLAINLYTLYKIYQRQEDFDLVPFNAGDEIITKFLQFYAKDLSQYFPHFTPASLAGNVRFMVVRDMAIANVFVASLNEEGTADIALNYTVPKYRDYKVGRYIFEKEIPFLVSKGIKRLRYKEVFNKSHAEFLQVMGFTKTLHNGQEYFTKSLV